jgi:parvulin-like peptidyl-prolyl isomerase
MKRMLVLVLLGVFGATQAGEKNSEGPLDPGIFAIIGGTVVPRDEFENNLHAGIRQRFFHGKVPEAELASFRREVASALIDRVLLLQEAERRGIKPDEAWVAARLRQWERRIAFASDPDQARAVLRSQLEGDSAIDQLRQSVENISAPDRAAMLAYYKGHADKFTTPERLRVSLILLKVEPWSSTTVWQGAYEEARRIVAKLRQGARFEDLARLHSADESAARGGDLGYIHKGMLADEAQKVVDGMKPGELSDPIQTLQGYAILRLDERVAPALNDFDRAETRVRELLSRELREQAWQAMLAGLRERTDIRVNNAVIEEADSD